MESKKINRVSIINRKTNETSIDVQINLDGKGKNNINFKLSINCIMKYINLFL